MRYKNHEGRGLLWAGAGSVIGGIIGAGLALVLGAVVGGQVACALFGAPDGPQWGIPLLNLGITLAGALVGALAFAIGGALAGSVAGALLGVRAASGGTGRGRCPMGDAEDWQGSAWQRASPLVHRAPLRPVGFA
jgi:hypothetical protein